MIESELRCISANTQLISKTRTIKKKKFYSRWVYLEPVFGAGTLRNEEALFRRIDKDFRYVMREIQADPRIISLIKINNISTIVNSLETQLTRCQNNLMTYIMVSSYNFQFKFSPAKIQYRLLLHHHHLMHRINEIHFLVFISLVTMICWRYWDKQRRMLKLYKNISENSFPAATVLAYQSH